MFEGVINPIQEVRETIELSPLYKSYLISNKAKYLNEWLKKCVTSMLNRAVLSL